MKKLFVSLLVLMMAFVLVGCNTDPTLSFDVTEYNIKVGGEETLSPKVTRLEGEAKDLVEYVSEDATIASVTDGKLKGLKAGETQITVKLISYTEITVTLTVKVTNVDVTSVSITGANAVKVAEEIQLTANILPHNATFKTVEWSVDDEDTATVSSTGVVKGLKIGEVVVTATAGTQSSTFTVTVNAPDTTAIIITGTSTMMIGDEQTLVASIQPETALQGVEWSSSDDALATVSETGKVNAIHDGTVVITATATDGSGISKTFSITIAPAVATAITLTGNSSMRVGETQQLDVAVTPSTITRTNTFSSTDTAIATVSTTGLVTAVGAGTVTIKVLAGGTTDVEDTVTITITDYNKKVIIVDATLTAGDTFVSEGIEYKVGNNAFTNLKDAYNAVTTGGTIIVKEGTYSDSFTIAKSVTIVGPNKNIDPNTGTRVAEAVITGTITLNAVSKVAINGIQLKDTGKIVSTVRLQDVTLAYLDVVNTAAATSTWTGSASNVPAMVSLFNAAGTSDAELSNKLVVKNCKFDVKDYALSFARSMNVTISNNVFTNFERDAVRFDGGYNSGVYTITGNTFENDTQGGNAGLFFRSVGGVKDQSKQEIYITNNIFKNIGVSTNSYSGAIVQRAYQEYGMSWEVTNNVFENCYNSMIIRNNASGANHTAYAWSFIANYNTFIGVPTGVYFKTRTESSDTTVTNPTLSNFDYNLFIDNDGKGIADLTSIADKFQDVLSYKNNFASQLDFDMYQYGITDTINIVVDGNWSTLAAGEKVTAFGIEFTVGTDAFGTIQAAIAAASDNDGIYIFAGTYTGDINIDKNGLKIYGANANVNPNYDKRNPETDIAGSIINVAKDTQGLKLQGLQFSGKTSLHVEKGGISDLVVSYCNYHDSTVVSGADGLVYGVSPTEAYNYNFKFEYTRFYALNDARTINLDWIDGLTVKDCYLRSKGTYYADGIKTTNVKGALLIENNTIESYGQFGLFIGSTSNNATSIDILNNTFNNYPWGTGMTGMPIVIRNYTKTTSPIINIKYNTFSNVVDTAIAIRHNAANATSAQININYNTFLGTIPTIYTTVESGAQTNAKNENLENNYFEDSAYASKVSGVVITAAYATAEEVPAYPAAPKLPVTGITILNEVTTLRQLDTYQLEYSVTPSRAHNKKVTFSSSDESVATVDANGLITALTAGTVTITITSVDKDTVEATMDLEIESTARIEIDLQGETTLETGDKATVLPTIFGAGDSTQVLWASGNTNILTISSSGEITAIGAGTAKITGTLANDANVKVEFEITVVDGFETLDALLQKFVEYNYSNVLYQKVKATGYQFVYYPEVYGSVSLYSFDPNTITNKEARLEKDPSGLGHPNRPGTKKASTEYVVVHDTASSAASGTALAHANYVFDGGGGTSWGYSVGNDGVYYQIPDDEVSFHAGDGTRPYQIEDTGIKATGSALDAKITFNANGCYEVNGTLTTLRPYVINSSVETKDTTNYTTSQINDYGVHCVIGDNGNYFLGKTYYNGTYKLISNYGGNYSSIGIETMVNQGSNLYWTWHKTAKLSAKLCIENDLDTSRIRPHHYFSGKNCPQTMRDNDLWYEFVKMTEAEYDIQKNFSDYTIAFKSNNPTILDNYGNIVKAPALTTSVSYTVTVTKAGVSKSITLSSIVEGTLGH